VRTRLFVALSLLSLSASAVAEEAVQAQAPPPERDRGLVLIAIKGGGLFSEPFSRLGASYLVDVEVGYALPVLQHRLAVALDAGFTAPEASGTQTDPRVSPSGGGYSWHLLQQELLLGLTFYYRHPIGRWTPYVGVGPRLFLLKSSVDGSAGDVAISRSTEVSTKVGAHIPVGVGVRLGPGDLFVEASLNISGLDHRTTGAANTGALTIALGYRLVL
jgi:opacity protein-like surface antigen